MTLYCQQASGMMYGTDSTGVLMISNVMLADRVTIGIQWPRGGPPPPKILSAILLFTSHASHSHIWLATRQA